MKFVAFGALAMMVAVAALLLMSRETSAALKAGERIPGQYIVVFVDGVNPSAVANEMAGEHGLRLLHVYSHALNGFAAQVPEGRLQALEKDPRVAFVEADRVVSIAHHCKGSHPKCGDPTPTPTPTPVPPGEEPSGNQTVPMGIMRINGGPAATGSVLSTGLGDVDVAVIDTGIDLDHPDLNVVGGVDCVSGSSGTTGSSGNGNGNGKGGGGDGGSTYDDGNGHGSHVAGTIGAYDNGTGVVGVAPGVRLWAVRVLNDKGSGTWAGVICGVDWVTGQGGAIDVANMSLSGSGSDGSCSSSSLHQAICNSVNAGTTYVVAAGNSSADASSRVPAAYDEVITVSALADFDGASGGLGSPTCRLDQDDTFADFSNYGSDVDIIAPGVCILSTWKDGGFNTISGTSMASPHVAGAAALYLASNLGANPAQVKSALQSAGNTDWDNSDDGDNKKEKLLDVKGF